MSGRALEDGAPNWLAIQKEATSSDSPYSMAERMYCLAVAACIRDNETAWPSIPTIARWAGASVSTMRRAAVRPCGEGGIFVRALRPGRSGSYEYRVRAEIVERWARGNPVQIDTGQPDTGQPEPRSGWKGTPFKLEGNPVQIDLLKTNEVPRKDARAANVERTEAIAERKPETPARTVLRSEWSELIGAPSRFFDDDVLGLVTPRRPLARVVESMRAYAAAVDISKASSRAFAQGIEGWAKAKAKPKAPEAEVYTGSDEQRREKAARYGVTL